jgi:hypothetical protein
MKFLAILAFIFCTNPVWAEDSPWFGSEASTAQQITLIDDETPNSAEIVLNTKQKCTTEQCPITDKLAK